MSREEEEEKALERLHTDASHVQGPDGSRRVWLNSVGVVDRIVRDFVLEVIENLERPGQFQNWLEFECRRMNNLFLGITPSDRYKTGPWNRPDQCGEYVLKALTINGESRLAVRDAFMIFAALIMEIMAKSGDKFDKDQLDAEIGRMRNALLGTARGFGTAEQE